LKIDIQNMFLARAHAICMLTIVKIKEANVAIFMSGYNDWKCGMANDFVDLCSRCAIYIAK
jgi:glutaredoxin-related protein